MSKFRSNSSPELLASTDREYPNNSTLEGAKENAKLLLKLIHDHPHASKEEKPQCVTGMMAIIDDIKSRLEKSQFPSRREAELRRCNTNLGHGFSPKERNPQYPITKENDKLRRELSASMMARKNLENMLTGVGKEKAFMAAELARKVQELSDVEELVNDLKTQNETLTEKVMVCAAEHKEKKNGIGVGGDSQALQERNKALSEQLLKSLDGYRSMERKLKEAQEKNARIVSKMENVAVEVAAGIEMIHGSHERVGKGVEGVAGIAEELAALEPALVGLQKRLAERRPKSGESVKLVDDVPAEKPSGLGAEGE